MKDKAHFDHIIELLSQGQVILSPTDTVWGIGCTIDNEESIDKIYKIKNRDKRKPFILLVSSMEMLKRYVPHIHPRIETLLFFHMKPITIIYKEPLNLPPYLIAKDNTIAIRMVKDSYIKQLIDIYDLPIVSTSANIQGEKTPDTFDTISQNIISQMDYIVPTEYAGTVNKSPSVIIKYDKNGQIDLVR